MAFTQLFSKSEGSPFMRAYFGGWKRKAGVATLLMALVLAGGWVRSKIVGDEFEFESGPASTEALESFNGSLLWATSIDSDAHAGTPPFRWHTRPASDYEHLRDPIYHWEFRALGFGVGHFGDQHDGLWIYVTPYWALVIPLTLLSALLLLSKPRPPNQLKTPVAASDSA